MMLNNYLLFIDRISDVSWGLNHSSMFSHSVSIDDVWSCQLHASFICANGGLTSSCKTHCFQLGFQRKVQWLCANN